MKITHERLMHRAATLVGGFAGMYTVLTRFNLGSSQTVCMLDMFAAFFGRDMREFLLRLLGITIYGAAVFTATYLTKKGKADTRIISAVLCAVCFAVLGFMPEDTDRCIALYPSFIMMAFLWVVFGSMGGYASAPIFSTNNYRQAVGGIAEYCADHDKKHLEKAKHFGGTLLMFHIGAAAAYFLCKGFGTSAAFFGLVPTAVLVCAVYAPNIAAVLHIKSLRMAAK